MKLVKLVLIMSVLAACALQAEKVKVDGAWQETIISKRGKANNVLLLELDQGDPMSRHIDELTAAKIRVPASIRTAIEALNKKVDKLAKEVANLNTDLITIFGAITETGK